MARINPSTHLAMTKVMPNLRRNYTAAKEAYQLTLSEYARRADIHAAEIAYRWNTSTRYYRSSHIGVLHKLAKVAHVPVSFFLMGPDEIQAILGREYPEDKDLENEFDLDRRASRLGIRLRESGIDHLLIGYAAIAGLALNSTQAGIDMARKMSAVTVN